MDVAQDIKNRLSIEDLVGQYCQLQKKGRNFVALCPFHKDSHPSLLVSPDKGIAYCFACQTGGDIFSFYQAIEGVDFRQALKDLGEKTGVRVEEHHAVSAVKKDEKERLRECLETAAQFYREQLAASATAQKYLADRSVPAEQTASFGLGYAPDSFSATYEHLLKKNFSRKEILAAGLGVQKELQEERIYDRFRHRLMFPIHDHQGNIVGFGGRTLGDDDAKYVNSSEGPLYHKSNVLFGLHHAKEAIRESRRVIIVEGYFDLLACHRVGAANVVATSGTALTEQHAKLLKRYAETVCLCLDSDRAGREAAERAFLLLSQQETNVRSVTLPRKDASELLQEDPGLLRSTLEEGGIPYLDRAIAELAAGELTDAAKRRDALRRLLTLLAALPFVSEKAAYVAKAAALFGVTERTLEDDLRAAARTQAVPPVARVPEREAGTGHSRSEFSKAEIALALFLLYPRLRNPLLQELIPPEEEFTAALHKALKEAPADASCAVDELGLAPEHRERAGIIILFVEEHGLAAWSENLAVREIRKNVVAANREALRRRQEELTKKIIAARTVKDATEEALLQNQYQQLLRLRKIAG
ncbi:MAG: DNA primase [Candidatus Peribacteraceae bacterium]|nr:DNA primase [Candidatus Peribacteraceae bacterium]